MKTTTLFHFLTQVHIDHNDIKRVIKLAFRRLLGLKTYYHSTHFRNTLCKFLLVMQRNLLVTKAFVGKAKIALLNTHLESTAEFSAQRKQQLMSCFEIAKSFSPEYNVLFGGDLNLRDKEVTGLLPMNMSDLWVKCGSRATCQYTWDLTRNTNKQVSPCPLLPNFFLLLWDLTCDVLLITS